MTHLDAPSPAPCDPAGSAFSAFGLADTILQSVRNEGFDQPTPIQSMAIPPLMEGHDLMGIAQTGGGKTAAFSLPMINKLLDDYQKPRQNMPKVLILAPTRELAQQIELCITTFSKGTRLKSLVIAGGQPYPPQTSKLRRGVDILVATPGRLIDHIGRNNVKFNDTATFILDEADRMLDMGFIDDVRDIAASLPQDHQTVMFSATMNPKVRNLSKSLLTAPVYVEIERKTAVADTISHKLMNVTRRNKAQLLCDILSGDGVEKALVFARTKTGADELSNALYEKGIRSDAIHGDKRQRVREKILMNFRRGRTRVLVATDVAARGIDVDGISHVVNYELPIEPENYVHRVGRTGRAGQKGIAISFCDPSDVRLLKNIEQLIKLPIEVDADHEFHIDVSSRGNAKGNKGRFARDRGGRREGGFGRDSRGVRVKSDRYKSGDAVKKANRSWESDAQDDHRPAPRKAGNSPRPERAARKKDGARYDPWSSAREYADDPVLGKLLGKPPEFDSKKEDKSDFVKTGARKKPFRKKEADNKPFEGKKARGGKKALTGKKNLSASRPDKARKVKARNDGGTKVFSPKRKPLKSTRAA